MILRPPISTLSPYATLCRSTGSGSGGTRNIGGTSHYHVALEHELATLHNKSKALLFSSAYVANEWSLIALPKIIPNLVYISDSNNHASMIEGIRHSKAPKIIWQHNDLEQLDELCASAVIAGQTPCIVFESVYSIGKSLKVMKKPSLANFPGF